MNFIPNIENRKEYYRLCECGRDHENKFIRGFFNYSEDNTAGFCAALIEHQNVKHVWLSFITGEWPNVGYEDCAVTSDIYLSKSGRVFSIKDGTPSPFIADDIFDCYQVTRDQVLVVEGAKEWFIETYLELFNTDDEIGSYLENK